MGQRRTDLSRLHTPEQVARKLREADRMLAEGKTIPEVSENTSIAGARSTAG
jgi:hypothetical protein